MTILPIITLPDPFLRKKSLPVDIIDDALKSFLDDMVETMYHDNGVGLAAVQVGMHKRILVVDPKGMDDTMPRSMFPLKVINPEIIVKSEKLCILNEGCLSVPDEDVDILRPEEVTIKFLDIDAKERVIECTGWFARILQHEIDHLDGKTIVDYVSGLKKDMILRRLIKAQRHAR